MCSLKKLPNPVFSRLLKEVARRDEIIKQHLNNYKVSETNVKQQNNRGSGMSEFISMLEQDNLMNLSKFLLFDESLFCYFNLIIFYIVICAVTREKK